MLKSHMPTRREFFLLAFLFAYTIAFSGVVLAWTGPTASAPSNNVSAPINVGSTAQIKTGGFWASSIGSDSGYCIGSSCITSWPSASTDLWTKSGSSIYYNTGNVGIGVTSPYFALQVDQPSATGGGIAVSTSGQDGSALNGISNRYSYTQTSSATRYPIGNANSIYAKIASGVTNSGYVMGIDDTILRNYAANSADDGTLASLIGERIQYGHYNVDPGSTPVTTAAIGIEINPLAYTGSIGTMYDLLLSGSSGSDFGTHYGIYQSGSALNYFGGKVGIGTSNPSATLDVNGTAVIGRPSDYWATSGFYGVSGLGQLSTDGSYETSLTSNGYRNSSGTWTSYGANGYTGASQIALSPQGYIDFRADTSKASGSATHPDTVMRITPAGSVGIGTASPGTKLTVAGEITSTNANAFRMAYGNYGAFWRNDGSNTYFLLTNSGDQYGTWNSLRPLTINDSSGAVTVGTGLTVSGNVSASAFLYTSDQSLKHNVQTIPDALSLVEKLRGVMFNWNSDDRPDMGVIAQEVQKVLPQLVHTDAATGLESVEYGNFIGIFIEAIKQVQGEVTNLQQENAQLTQQNAQLTQEVQSLDARVSALEAAR
ncbi:MAG TPA: tail fiber domain-containing protein [Candidatus Paceibacterota bacterium]|nr:tail fiber domain-containing protein [Candidatus Paceibacterota bacterium]